MLLRDGPYRDMGLHWLDRRNDEAHIRRPVAQLDKLGHDITSTNRPPDSWRDILGLVPAACNSTSRWPYFLFKFKL
jgi:hypothetical protein